MTKEKVGLILFMNAHIFLMGGFVATLLLCIPLLYLWPNGGVPIQFVMPVLLPAIIGTGIVLLFGFNDKYNSTELKDRET